MASKKDPYEVRQVRTTRQMKKLVKHGWKLMGQSGGFLMTATTYTLRRRNPKYRGAPEVYDQDRAA